LQTRGRLMEFSETTSQVKGELAFGEFGLIGRCRVFKESLQLIRCMADNDAMALIQGETGTGKEMAARAVHYSGARRAGPFIPVNCAGLPDALIENELFGHTRGAYTDARESQNGLIADAEHGTLFLDEIECLSARGQGVLIRFLQDLVYRPLGGRACVRADVRVIAASNRDLAELVRQGTFRQDLFYRIGVIAVTMPPLRTREEDVSLLAQYFFRRFAHQYGREEITLQPALREAMLRHAWPGNVRELENLVHRIVLTGDHRATMLSSAMEAPAVLSEDIVPRHSAANFGLGFRLAKSQAVADFERAYLTWALEETKGNVSSAAQRARKERASFNKLLRKHGTDRSDFVSG
jgi:two-component system, NtrC family, response regulator GlrR